VESHLRTFLLGTTHVDRERILVGGAIRAGVLVAVAVSLAIYRGTPNAGIPLAIGVIFVALAESGESVGRRWRTMLWTTLWLMGATLLGGLVSDSPVFTVIASAAVAFGAGLAGAAGPRASVGGVLTLVVFIVFAGAPQLPAATLDSTLLMGLGGVLVTASTVLPRLFSSQEALKVALEPVPSMWMRIRDHVRTRDSFLRHAVRLSVAIPIATLFAILSGFPHAYWLPMTIAWVTKPDVSGTVTRVAGRILGTAIGLTVSAILLLVFEVSGYAAGIVVAIAGGVAVAFVWANYAVGVAGVTVLVVVMFSFDDSYVPEDLALRMLATVVAAAMAIGASYIWRGDSTTPTRG
jgi:uncharacterized membrane protein YccC